MTRRVLVTVVAACALGLAVLFVPAALVERQQNRHTDLLEMQRLAAVATRSLPPSGRPDRWRPPDTDPHHVYGLYDAAGHRIGGTGPAAADAVVSTAIRDGSAAAIAGAEVVAAVGLGPQPALVVRVAEPLAESTTRTATTLAWLLALAVVALLISAVAGWLLLRRLLAPVTAATRAAARLGDGDFTVTVPHTGLPEFDQLGAALTAASGRIGQLVERERAFTADASHQLRTPVSGAIVALETELRHPRPDRTAILDETLRVLIGLERTVTDLLQLARDTHAQRARLDLRALLYEARADWAPRCRAVRRPLQVRARALPVVSASPTALRHVLDVLLDNALRHGAGPIRLEAAVVVGGVAVTVSEDGPGPAHPDSLFRRRAPGAAGTGIGLALARSLAEAEGARLRLAGTGPTVFELLIPLGPPPRP